MSARAPGPPAPYGAGRRDMGAHDGGIEHLHQMSAVAQVGQSVEKRLEHAGAGQPPEALPHAVPVAELGRQRPPGDVVHREIVQRFQKLAVVAALVAAARQAGGWTRNTNDKRRSTMYELGVTKYE